MALPLYTPVDPPLGAWRHAATVYLPALTDDGKGGQQVAWTAGATFVAAELHRSSTEAIQRGGALRSTVLVTLRTWWRPDLDPMAPALGMKVRLACADGSRWEVTGAEPVPGPLGEPLYVDLLCQGMTAAEFTT